MAHLPPNTGYEPNHFNFFQLHGHRSHADPPPRQPPRFPVPGRRYRDLHYRSRRFAALRSIQQQQTNSSKQSSSNVRTLKPLETVGRSSVGSTTGAISDRESVATTILSAHLNGKRDRGTNAVHSLKERENLRS